MQCIPRYRCMDMNNILVATDLSGESENAFIRAIQLSKLAGATLHVLHVTRSIPVYGNPDQAARIHAELGDRIQDFIGQYAASANIEYEVHIENYGRVYERVVEYASEVRADLVVIGQSTRPDGIPNSVFLTTSQIVKNSSAPVLVVTQPVSGTYRQIHLETHLSVSPGAVLTPARDFGPDIRLTLLINAKGESDDSAGILQRLISGWRRRRCDYYLARAASLLQGRGNSGKRVSLDIVEHDYEAVLASKLKDEEIDVVGLLRMRQKLRSRESEIDILAAVQVASCDFLSKA